MEPEHYRVTIRFLDAKGSTVAEKVYESLKKPTNGAIKVFARQQGIVYNHWIYAR